MGYHIRDIPKGKLGELSKIFEEYSEFYDATIQKAKVLEICELCDLLGAIEAYTTSKYNLTIEDLKQMADLTKKAFLEGSR